MSISMKHFKSPTTKQGYMLVEILVSVMIFTLIAVTSASALLSLIDANAKSQTMKAVMDNLSVAVENMSRTIRIGTDYTCFKTIGGTESNSNDYCDDGTIGISFIPQDSIGGNRDQYYFSDGAIYRKRGTDTAVALTAPEVVIEDLSFFVFNGGSTPGQARVFININGKAGRAGLTSTPFNIQTSVAQREIESI